jgi:hypothetical protein
MSIIDISKKILFPLILLISSLALCEKQGENATMGGSRSKNLFRVIT